MSYSLISCKGFTDKTGFIASGDCWKSKFGLVILFFLFAFIRKGCEMAGIAFNMWTAVIPAELAYFIAVSIMGSFKIAMVIGLVAGLAGGFFGGMMFESEGGD